MFCPGCRSEFRVEITFCQGCEVDLVEALDAVNLFDSIQNMENSLADRPLSPAMMGTQAELRRIQEDLYKERLPSILANAGVDIYQPGMAQQLYLMVLEEDLPKIATFLKKNHLESVQREGVVEEVSLGQISLCPACGGEAPGDAAECPECGLMLGVSEDLALES